MKKQTYRPIKLYTAANLTVSLAPLEIIKINKFSFIKMTCHSYTRTDKLSIASLTNHLS